MRTCLRLLWVPGIGLVVWFFCVEGMPVSDRAPVDAMPVSRQAPK